LIERYSIPGMFSLGLWGDCSFGSLLTFLPVTRPFWVNWADTLHWCAHCGRGFGGGSGGGPSCPCASLCSPRPLFPHSPFHHGLGFVGGLPMPFAWGFKQGWGADKFFCLGSSVYGHKLLSFLTAFVWSSCCRHACSGFVGYTRTSTSHTCC
jgi:hypothetical protein